MQMLASPSNIIKLTFLFGADDRYFSSESLTTLESDTPAAFTNVKSEAKDFQISKLKGAERIRLLSADLDPEAASALFDANIKNILQISKRMSPERLDERNTCFDRSGSHREQLATSMRRNKGVLGLADMAK